MQTSVHLLEQLVVLLHGRRVVLDGADRLEHVFARMDPVVKPIVQVAPKPVGHDNQRTDVARKRLTDIQTGSQLQNFTLIQI